MAPLDLRGRATIADAATRTLRAIKGQLDAVGAATRRIGAGQFLGNVSRSIGVHAGRMERAAGRMSGAAATAGLGFAGIIAATREFNESKFGYGLAQIPEYLKSGQFNAAGLTTEMGQAAERARTLARELGVMPDAAMKALEEVQKIGIGGATGESLWRSALGLSMADRDLASGEAVKFMGTIFRAYEKQRNEMARKLGQDPASEQFIDSWLKSMAAKAAVAAAESALGPRDLVEGMRQYAPQWAQFGMSPEFAMAALAHGANYGFRAPELGTAFKSMANRAIKPTAEGLRWLNALGIDRTKHMSTDAADPERASNQLNSLLGGSLGKKQKMTVRQMLMEAQKAGTTAAPEFQEQLTQRVAKMLGRKTEHDIQEIQQAVANATLSSGGQIDLGGLIRELIAKKAGPAALMSIFEGRHYARGTPMFEFYEKFHALMEKLHSIDGSALDAVTSTRKESEAGKTTQMFAAWQDFLLALEQTGVIETAKNALIGLADTLRSLPPEAVKWGTALLLAAGGLSALGVALKASGLMAVGRLAGKGLLAGDRKSVV